MPPRRVTLLTNRSLFAAGVEELLLSVDGMTLSVVDATDSGAMEKIAVLRPQVIVLDLDDDVVGRAAVVRILEVQPQARVVALNLNHSGIDVYRMKRVIPTDVAGLVRAIQGHVGQSRRASTADE